MNDTTDKPIILYREHRGGLAESMQTARPVRNFGDLVRIIRESRTGWPDQGEVVQETVRIEPYGYDKRTDWDTHIVTVNGRAVGFTNGPVSA